MWKYVSCNIRQMKDSSWSIKNQDRYKQVRRKYIFPTEKSFDYQIQASSLKVYIPHRNDVWWSDLFILLKIILISFAGHYIASQLSDFKLVHEQ